MKANELMIGDWVSYTEQEYIEQVIAIDALNNLLGFSNGKCVGINWCPADECNPIHLTAKILETNGWQKENDGLCWYDDRYDNEQVYVYCPIRTNGYVRKLEICNNRKSYISEVEEVVYVHELQRALRCCGLWDLANNFKI